MNPGPCDRYPCDTAYRRGTHEPNANGQVVHQIRWGHESRRTPDDEFPAVWLASAIAFDDHAWQPYVYVEDGRRVFDDPQEAHRLADAIHQSTMWSLKTNLEEAAREI